MVPAECRNWDYEKHPKAAVVGQRCVQILVELRNGMIPSNPSTRDSRPIHHRLFKGLTPDACRYLAGHYRGENYPSLIDYEVTAGGHPRVGCPAVRVDAEMRHFSSTVGGMFQALAAAAEIPVAVISAEHKLIYLANFVAHVHQEFLRIHPYANGNGHTARFIVWAMLGHFGYWPISWPFDDRPGDPYVHCLTEYRNGNPEPLVQLILRAIAGT